MPTTIHLSPDLLESVDRRAGELGISRNRYISHALEKAIDEETSWSPRFLKALAAARDDSEGRELVEQMTEAIAAHRTRKAPAEL